MKPTIQLALALHNHQPVGNFDWVFEDAYKRAYLPMLEALERHPGVRLAIHNTGCLLDWMVVAHPEYIERLGELVAKGQIEMMTGGYYEPILVSLPDADKHGQINKLSNTVRELFNYNPTGAWLAERVWEPHLPKPLAEAGVDYTIVDDTHFRYAGLNNDDMFGYYVSEEQGYPVKIFGTAQHLRYTIPWVSVKEVIEWLREQAERDLPQYANVQKVAVMGDDGEKFGLWPRTYNHCWEKGWIDDLFAALEANASWLTTTTLGGYAKNNPAMGQLYMPAASYDEMTEWALPGRVSAEISHIKHQLEERNHHHILKFVKGGLWRGFLSKYPEVNQMHKKTLSISRKVAAMPDGPDKEKALDLLWSAQCNCGYWHGLFGGIYLFHIRGANYRNLISAEKLADATQPDTLTVEQTDYTRNGTQDVVVANKHQWLLLDVANGGSIVEWDYRDAPYNLLNTMSRREEGYHADIADAAASGTLELFSSEGEVENVHGTVVKVKELGLERKLTYDWYRRGALHDRFLPLSTNLDQYAAMMGERGDFVNQPYSVKTSQTQQMIEIEMMRHGGVWQASEFAPVSVFKRLRLSRDSSRLSVRYIIKNQSKLLLRTRFGIENNWGLEGGQDGLTYFDGLETPSGGRQYPGHCGVASDVQAYDLTSDISTVATKITHQFSRPADIWWFPIECVTNSEAGYEANYQGTAILNSWHIELVPTATWQLYMTIDLSQREVV